MCEWLAEQHQGRWATLVDLAQSVPSFLVFREPGAGIPHDLHEAMDSLCRLVGETPPRTYHLFRIHHPVVLLHWRVQAHLVSRLSPELHRAYRQLFAAETINERPLSTYGLRGMVDPPDPSPTVRVVLVDHLCHPALLRMCHRPGAPWTRQTTLRRKMRPASRWMPAMQRKSPFKTLARGPLSLGSACVQELERATPQSLVPSSLSRSPDRGIRSSRGATRLPWGPSCPSPHPPGVEGSVRRATTHTGGGQCL